MRSVEVCNSFLNNGVKTNVQNGIERLGTWDVWRSVLLHCHQSFFLTVVASVLRMLVTLSGRTRRKNNGLLISNLFRSFLSEGQEKKMPPYASNKK